MCGLFAARILKRKYVEAKVNSHMGKTKTKIFQWRQAVIALFLGMFGFIVS